jgi:integrase
MRTKHPTYTSADGRHLLARVRIWENGQWIIRRFKQLIPEHITAPTERIKWARDHVKRLKCDSSRLAELAYLKSIQGKRTSCTIGHIRTAVSDPTQKTRKSSADQRRMMNQLDRVLAIALDLWTQHKEGMGIQGVKIGDDIPDRTRIDTLPASVLNEDTKRKYFMRALHVDVLDWTAVYENAAGINSRLNQARDLFRGLQRTVLLAGLDIPDIDGFMRGRLKSADPMPDPVEAAEYAKIVELFDGLKPMRHDLWLCDLVIRQTGLRSLSSAMQIHRTWLKKLDDGHYLNVEGKTKYQIPITDELATEILKSENYLFFPDAAAADAATRKRNAALRNTLLENHTAMLRTIIGETTHTPNHRLRDTVASALYHGMDMQTAQEALGHADEKTTRRHYARRMDVNDTMRHQLRAWLRVQATRAGWRTSNIIPMPTAAQAKFTIARNEPS